MQELENNQDILNTVFDPENAQIKGVAKSGKKQFLQYYIDNNKLGQLLPVQIILNSVFDRQSASLCISGNTVENSSSTTVSLSDYSGQISLKDENGNNVLTVQQNKIKIGSNEYQLSINVSDILLNGNQLNSPNGLVTLNSQGKLNSDVIKLNFDPNSLTVIDNLNQLSNSVQITVRLQNGTYKAATIQQLIQLCQPQLIVME